MPTESLHHTIADDQQDMRVAYFGGMLIYPVAVLIAMATTAWMIFCLALAIVIFVHARRLSVA